MKYGPEQAVGWTGRAYADPVRMLARRSQVVRSLGPLLEPGDTVLDLACGDGAFAEFLLPHGLEYLGVDNSPAMVAEATHRLGDRARIEHGDVDSFTPDEPVAATTLFRGLYYSRDRTVLFRRAASFTEKKLAFDVSPRRFSRAKIRAELGAAGWTRIELRPFFVPQRVALPGALQRLLFAAESSRGLSSLLLRFKFTYVCAAWRS